MAWCALLLAPNLLYILIADNALDVCLRTVPPSLAALVALTAWTRRPKWVLWVTAPLYALLPFELYYILNYGRPTSAHVLAVVTESNVTEAIEYLGAGMLAGGAAVGISLVAITLFIANSLAPLRRHRAVTWLRWASLIPVLQYAWMETDWLEQRKTFDLSAHQTSLEALLTTEVATPTSAMLSDSWPLGVVFRLRDYLEEQSRLREAAQLITTHDFEVAAQPKADAVEEIYVLVLGESSNPMHWSANGYPRPTTPRITKAGAYSFRNVISPFPATRLAVPVIITGHQDHQSGRSPLGRASIVSLFKQAGFYTYWLSSQAPLGLHDSLIAVHAYQADTVLYANGGDYTQHRYFDGALIPVFERFLNEGRRRKFFVIHLLGSHKAYAHRYPPAFDHFRPSLQTNPSDSTHESVINTYDNTILYTDHVLGELIKRLETKADAKAALLYVSDHGQNLPSQQCPSSGHGRNNESDYRVSAMIWLSPEYKNRLPQTPIILASRHDAPLHAVEVFHTLAHLAGIDYRARDTARSWAAPDFVPTTRWTLAAPDFDKARKEPPCGRLIPH